jgi:hypothetical protein
MQGRVAPLQVIKYLIFRGSHEVVTYMLDKIQIGVIDDESKYRA